MINASVNCPICHSEGRHIRTLKRKFILNELERYYAEKISEHLDICDYEILRCSHCSLEFASPMQAGSENFYQWLTKHPDYYPDSRWEWVPVLEKIKQHSSEPMNLLEVGCGSGNLLEAAQQIPNLRAIGLDTTSASVEQCRARGIEVYCETLESFLTTESAGDRKFDFVVAFHCLEHVSDPKGLMQSMRSALKPTGSIFVSTPYSPMSFETLWFDPLNHPPHHLTRWNASAYNELARQLNLKISLLMPPAARTIDRVLYTLNYAWNGPGQAVSRRRIQLAALRHPLVTLAEWRRQRRREQVNNQVAADVVLVEFTPIDHVAVRTV